MSEHITFCPIPFDHLNKEGERYATCCPGWLESSRFVWQQNADPWKAWNHPILVELRQAILDQDWRYCQKCPNRFRKQNRVRQPSDHAVMQRPPVTVGFVDNRTCNLACPSCRSHIIREQTKHPPSITEMCEAFEGKLGTVAVNVSGDPFANKEHLAFLQTEGPEHVILWTNGVLLPRYWDSIKRRVTVLVTSIDAATKETYEWVRQPAKWSHLMACMAKCHEIVSRDQVMIWQCNFVVQSANYREMPMFAEMCLEYGATAVQYTPIAPWEHITPDQWRERNIQNPEHPDYMEYLQVLQDPRLRLPGVDAGLISPQSTAWFADAEPQQDYFSAKQ